MFHPRRRYAVVLLILLAAMAWVAAPNPPRGLPALPDNLPQEPSEFPAWVGAACAPESLTPTDGDAFASCRHAFPDPPWRWTPHGTEPEAAPRTNGWNGTWFQPRRTTDYCGGFLRRGHWSYYNETHRCLAWRTGRFRSRVPSTDAPNLPRGNCTAHDLAGAAFRFRGGPPTAVQPRGALRLNLERCRLHELTAHGVLSVLRRASLGGRRVLVMSGDSMMRQLFMRAVAFFRGQAPVVEHGGAMDFVYVLRAHDDALHASLTNRRDALRYPDYTDGPAPECRVDDAANPCLLLLQFFWEPIDDALRNRFFRRGHFPFRRGVRSVAPPGGSDARLPAWTPGNCTWNVVVPPIGPRGALATDAALLPPLHLHSSMYWFRPPLPKKAKRTSSPTSRLTIFAASKRYVNFVTNLAEAMGHAVPADPRRCAAPRPPNPYHYVHLTAPPVDGFDGGERNPPLAKRNHALRGSVGGVGDGVNSTGRVFDMAALLEGLGDTRRRQAKKDHIHFQCTVMPLRPGPVRWIAGDWNGCRDDVNYALLQWYAALAAVLFPPPLR